MSTLLEPVQSDHSAGEVPPFPVKRWTLEEYHRLIDLGWFDNERVELLDGWIVPKMTKNPPHEAAVARAMETLRPLLPAECGLRIQSAISLGGDEPEPDLAVVKGPGSGYVKSHPGPGDVDLVIEVSDTSLRHDRRKAHNYSRGNIPAYWIVNLTNDCVEAFSQPLPAEERYSVQRTFRRGETLTVSLQSVLISVPVTGLLLDSPLPSQE